MQFVVKILQRQNSILYVIWLILYVITKLSKKFHVYDWFTRLLTTITRTLRKSKTLWEVALITLSLHWPEKPFHFISRLSS
jgi:hypothetical protein